MIIFPKKDIIPIITPLIYYEDKYNNTNSYVQTNPSMYIDKDGNVTILVRCVNYKKYPQNKFIMYSTHCHSNYQILTGKIYENKKLDLENFDFSDIIYNFNLPSYPTSWSGLEDVRFIDNKNIIVNVPQLNEQGKPAIFKAEILENNVIGNFIKCQPNKIEKNWMPYFNNNNECHVIYSLTPFVVKSIENDDQKEINISETIKNELNGYHGSTNGIFLNKYERLFLIHKNKEKTIHKWLLFNVKTESVFLSNEFTFFKNSYIEFSCSLCNYNDRIFITLGLNDNTAYVIESCNKDIVDTFPKYNNIEGYPTIVTMLYDIRSLEGIHIERNRTVQNYIEFSKKFILNLPFPIIFFIDDNEETYDAISEIRKGLNLLDKTYIYMNDFKTTYFYKDLSRLEELQKQFRIINGVIEHETPLYVILNNNKFDCIDKAIKINPFNSSHLIWMDFGVNHVSLDNDRIFQWISKVPDKIKQMCINPFIENVQYKNYFQYIYHNMAGGLFSGSLENMKKYSELFKAKTEEIYNDNWYQIDEAVMTIVHRENPGLFELYYGDYQGIVSNYLYPIHNLQLIFKSSQKYLDHNKTKETFHLMMYCSEYFKNNPNSELIFYYIQQHIIVDFYHNDVNIMPEIIDLINSKLNSENDADKEKMRILLHNNKLNINLYKNKNLINY